MKYVLYGNGGSGNHGCEAIIRGTQQVLKGDYIIQSQSIVSFITDSEIGKDYFTEFSIFN